MKKLLILISLTFTLSACGEEKICEGYWNGIGRCHTKAEWDKISEDNWKSVACMNDEKNQKKAWKGTKDVNIMLDNLEKLCNVKSIGRLEFR